MNIAETAASISTGKLDPVEHAQAHLARVAAGNAALHAMVAMDEAALLRDAANLRDRIAGGRRVGPLAGAIIAVKDAFDVAGLPTTANCRLYAGAPPAARDAEAVARLRQAGALILGKANCWEMSVGGPSRDSPFPPAVNPWRRGADPGGSSNGSAVAVASGMAMAALGGDTGGSIRLPAAFCGLAGFKPTHGLVPMDGAIPFAESLDVIGPIAPTAADCAVLHAVLSGQRRHRRVGLRGLRLASISDPYWNWQFPKTRLYEPIYDELRRLVGLLAKAGVRLTRAQLPSGPLFNDCYFLIARSEAYARWRTALAQHPEAFNSLTRRSFAIGAMIPPSALADALRLRQSLRAEVEAALEGVDALILPTAPDEAGTLDAGDSFSRPDTAPFTRPFSLVGVPAVTIPICLGIRGLPLGVQLVGRRGEDARLLAIASALETVFGTAPRP